ncbi:hypothetical protein EON79_19090 [bacterium]|nr:MAG: hypothetical protein EON79_19090 [bacterium]
MKKSLGMPAIVAVTAIALIALVAVFFNMNGDPEPTAKNVPDYSKMTPEQVSASYADGKKAESEALAQRPK